MKRKIAEMAISNFLQGSYRLEKNNDSFKNYEDFSKQLIQFLNEMELISINENEIEPKLTLHEKAPSFHITKALFKSADELFKKQRVSLGFTTINTESPFSTTFCFHDSDQFSFGSFGLILNEFSELLKENLKKETIEFEDNGDFKDEILNKNKIQTELFSEGFNIKK